MLVLLYLQALQEAISNLKSAITFLIILFIISCEDIGKGYQWNKASAGFSRHFGTVGYDYGWSAAYSIIDDGIIIVGQKAPQIGGKSDLWAIKTNSRGIMEWEKSFGGDNNDVGYDVISTTDGGFLFVGHSWSFGNEQQVYVIKTDFSGNTEWEKTYGGSMWDVGNSVIELENGGFLIVGYSNSPSISSGNTDFFIIKIDINGELIWEKAFGNTAFPNHEWAYDVVQLSDGGFIISGARDRYDQGGLNGLVIRINEEGELIWEKEFLEEEGNSEIIYSISNSINGAYFLCASVNSITAPLVYQPKIIKIDEAGNIDWERTFISNSRDYHQFRGISTSSGDVVIVGSSSNQSSVRQKEDAFMTKIDSKGNIIWSSPYGSADEDDWGWAVFETAKSNLIFVGSTKSFGSSLFDIYLVSTNSDGISK